MGILGRFRRVPQKQLLKDPGTRYKRQLDEPKGLLVPRRQSRLVAGAVASV